MTTKPSAPPPEDPKRKATFAAASKVVKSVDLDMVRFRSFSGEALEAREALGENTQLDVSASFLRPEVRRVEEGLACRTTLVFEIKSKDDTSGAERTVVILRAGVEAAYGFKDAQTFTDEELNDFALCYCPFHVWGYWREYVQSSLARLEYPPFTMPLFLIAHAPDMVKDRIE